MAVCRNKEAELLQYTQKVTEKNVTLQSEFSSIQAKVNTYPTKLANEFKKINAQVKFNRMQLWLQSFALEEENEKLKGQIEQLQVDFRNLEKMMSQECKNYREERLVVENDVEKQRQEIVELQHQLDEARGEIALLQKNLNSKIRVRIYYQFTWMRPDIFNFFGILNTLNC